eukprot:358614-Chlamydomonas_euryale.AAC.6
MTRRFLPLGTEAAASMPSAYGRGGGHSLEAAEVERRESFLLEMRKLASLLTRIGRTGVTAASGAGLPHTPCSSRSSAGKQISKRVSVRPCASLHHHSCV